MEILPVQKKDILPIANFLHREMDNSYPVEKWKRLFEYQWTIPEHYGFMAVEAQKILGFLGCVLSPIRGDQSPQICNLSSWCVDRTVRGSGVGSSLFSGFLKENRWHQTMLTAASYLVPIYQNFGYRPYETHRYVFSAKGKPNQLNGWTDSQIPVESLLDVDQKIYHDHKDHRCRAIYLEHKNESCFLLLKDIQRKGGVGYFSELLYCNHLEFLSIHAASVGHFAIKDENSVFAADRRYFLERPFGGKEEELYSPRLAKIVGTETPFLHATYSEVVLLDLKM